MYSFIILYQTHWCIELYGKWGSPILARGPHDGLTFNYSIISNSNLPANLRVLTPGHKILGPSCSDSSHRCRTRRLCCGLASTGQHSPLHLLTTLQWLQLTVHFVHAMAAVLNALPLSATSKTSLDTFRYVLNRHLFSVLFTWLGRVPTLSYYSWSCLMFILYIYLFIFVSYRYLLHDCGIPFQMRWWKPVASYLLKYCSKLTYFGLCMECGHQTSQFILLLLLLFILPFLLHHTCFTPILPNVFTH